jgi:hypothetical protein
MEGVSVTPQIDPSVGVHECSFYSRIDVPGGLCRTYTNIVLSGSSLSSPEIFLAPIFSIVTKFVLVVL